MTICNVRVAEKLFTNERSWLIHEMLFTNSMSTSVGSPWLRMRRRSSLVCNSMTCAAVWEIGNEYVISTNAMLLILCTWIWPDLGKRVLWNCTRGIRKVNLGATNSYGESRGWSQRKPGGQLGGIFWEYIKGNQHLSIFFCCHRFPNHQIEEENHPLCPKCVV